MKRRDWLGDTLQCYACGRKFLRRESSKALNLCCPHCHETDTFVETKHRVVHRGYADDAARLGAEPGQ